MSKTDIIERELCRTDDITKNSMKEITVKLDDTSSVKVLLIKFENEQNEIEFSCLASKCTHYATPLALGVLYKQRLRCPADGACFNVKNGNIETQPGPDSLPCFNVYVDSKGMVQLKSTRLELESNQRLNTEVTKQIPLAIPMERFERPKGSASMQRPKTSLANRAGSANARNRHIQVIPKEALESVKSNKLPKILVIGSGAAGLVCVDTLREFGFTVDSSLITVLTADSQLPYDRPKLSKKLDVNIDSISLRDKDYFFKNNITYKTDESVNSIDFNGKRAACKSGNEYHYDKLIIATGLKPVLPDRPGKDSSGILTIRSLDDVAAIQAYFEALSDKRSGQQLNVIFLGGSFVSMESVCYFVEKQAKTKIIARTKPFEKLLGADVARKLSELHESKGVEILVDKDMDVKEFKGNSDGAVTGIEMSNGHVYPCDLCIVCFDKLLLPCTEFLVKNGDIKLTPDNLVLVDKNMRTNLSDVYAAGDITSFPRSCLSGLDVQNRTESVNIRHWGLAAQQGRTAALAIVNQTRTEQVESEFKHVPFFWTTQFGKSIRFSGYNHQYDSVVFHECKENPIKFVAFYMISNKVVGVCSCDWDPICAVYAEALHNKIEVRREHIEKDPNDLKKLLLI